MVPSHPSSCSASTPPISLSRRSSSSFPSLIPLYPVLETAEYPIERAVSIGSTSDFAVEEDRAGSIALSNGDIEPRPETPPAMESNLEETEASPSSSPSSNEPPSWSTADMQNADHDLPMAPPHSRPISPSRSGTIKVQVPCPHITQTQAMTPPSAALSPQSIAQSQPRSLSYPHPTNTSASRPPASASQSYRSDGTYLPPSPTRLDSKGKDKARITVGSGSGAGLGTAPRTDRASLAPPIDVSRPPSASSTFRSSSSALPSSSGARERGQARKTEWVIDVERIDPGMEVWEEGQGSEDGRVILVLGDAPRSSVDHLRRSPHLRHTLLILPKPSSTRSNPGSSHPSSSSLSSMSGSENRGPSAGHRNGGASGRPKSKLRLSSLSMSPSIGTMREAARSRADESGSETIAEVADEMDDSADASDGPEYPTVQYLAGPGLERTIRDVLDEATGLAKAWRTARASLADPISAYAASRPSYSNRHSRASPSGSASSYGMTTPMLKRDLTSSIDPSSLTGWKEETLMAPRPRYAHSNASSDGSSVASSSRRSSLVSEVGGRLSVLGNARRASWRGDGTGAAPKRAVEQGKPVFDAIIAFSTGGQGQGQAAAQAMLHDALTISAAAVPLLGNGTSSAWTLPPKFIQVIPHGAPERLSTVLDSYLASLLRHVNPGRGQLDVITGFLIHRRILDKPIQRQGDSDRSSPFDLLLSGALRPAVPADAPREAVSSLYLQTLRGCRFVTGSSSPSSTPVMPPSHFQGPGSTTPLAGPNNGSRDGSVSDDLSIPSLSPESDSASSGDARPTTPTTPRAATSGFQIVPGGPKRAVETQPARSEGKKPGWISRVFRKRVSSSGTPA